MGSARRFVKPSAWERLRLLWTFRNFSILPQQVLTQRQLKLIQTLCSHGPFASPESIDEDAVIGTVEFSPASWLMLPPKRAC